MENDFVVIDALPETTSQTTGFQQPSKQSPDLFEDDSSMTSSMGEEEQIFLLQKRCKRCKPLKATQFFLFSWNCSCIYSLITPLIFFWSARLRLKYSDTDYDNEAGDEYYEFRSCEGESNAWWKYWCNDNDEVENDYRDTVAPWWWSWKGRTNDEDTANSANRVMTFLYFWTVSIIIGVMILVNKKFAQKQYKVIMWAIIGLFNYLFICSIMIGGIPQLIIDLGHDMIEEGWYSLPSVLVFMTCGKMLSTCLLFAFWSNRIIKEEQGEMIEQTVATFKSTPYLLKTWHMVSMLGVVVPLIIFTYARVTNQEENANYGYADQRYREFKSCDVESNTTKWKYWCNGDDDEFGEDFRESVPWWWSWNARQEDIDATDSTNRVMVFLYIWTVLLIIGLGLLVNRNFIQGRKKFVRWTFIVFANYFFIFAILIGGIPQLIIDEGEELGETGFYGQPSVLIFLTCIFEFIVCIGFGARIVKRIENKEGEANDYKSFKEEEQIIFAKV